MVREIIKDPVILTQKCYDFIPGRDDHVIQDLLDTANAHKESCAGLAANQIGERTRVIVVRKGDKFVPFINPRYMPKGNKTYFAEEGCLSLPDTHHVKRHERIMVKYEKNGKNHYEEFSGRTAQILQHEIDHLNGILI